VAATAAAAAETAAAARPLPADGTRCGLQRTPPGDRKLITYGRFQVTTATRGCSC